VPEAAPFCSNCGAPQIFVKTPSLEEPNAGLPAASSANQTEQVYDSQQLNWKKAFPASLKAGAGMGLATLLLAALFPVWMVAGGWLAVVLYRRRSFGRELAAAAGAKLGAVAGLLGFAFFALVSSSTIAIKVFVLHQGAELRNMLMAALEQAASRNPDPRVQPMMEWVRTPEGLAFVIISCMVLLFVAFLVLGTLGGLVGASLNRKRS
jgi:hypothetical protein